MFRVLFHLAIAMLGIALLHAPEQFGKLFGRQFCNGFFYFGEVVVHPIHSVKMIWNPQLAPWIALGTLISIAAGCFYKIRSLSEGGISAMPMWQESACDSEPRLQTCRS